MAIYYLSQHRKLEEAVRQQALDFAKQAEGEFCARFPGQDLKITIEILRGAPDQQIIEIASEWNADLIVVGSHGRGFWGRLLGSVSTGVVHHAPCSVLVVRHPTE